MINKKELRTLAKLFGGMQSRRQNCLDQDGTWSDQETRELEHYQNKYLRVANPMVLIDLLDRIEELESKIQKRVPFTRDEFMKFLADVSSGDSDGKFSIAGLTLGRKLDELFGEETGG